MARQNSRTKRAKTANQSKIGYLAILTVIAAGFLTQFGRSWQSGLTMVGTLLGVGLYLFILRRRNVMEGADYLEILAAAVYFVWWVKYVATHTFPSFSEFVTVTLGYTIVMLYLVHKEKHGAFLEFEFNAVVIFGVLAYSLRRADLILDKASGYGMINMILIMEYMGAIAAAPLIYNFLLQPVISYFRHDVIVDVRRATSTIATVPARAVNVTQEMVAVRLHRSGEESSDGDEKKRFKMPKLPFGRSS